MEPVQAMMFELICYLAVLYAIIWLYLRVIRTKLQERNRSLMLLTGNVFFHTPDKIWSPHCGYVFHTALFDTAKGLRVVYLKSLDELSKVFKTHDELERALRFYLKTYDVHMVSLITVELYRDSHAMLEKRIFDSREAVFHFT
jgi:hypothetical protein